MWPCAQWAAWYFNTEFFRQWLSARWAVWYLLPSSSAGVTPPRPVSRLVPRPAWPASQWATWYLLCSSAWLGASWAAWYSRSSLASVTRRPVSSWVGLLTEFHDPWADWYLRSSSASLTLEQLGTYWVYWLIEEEVRCLYGCSHWYWIEPRVTHLKMKEEYKLWLITTHNWLLMFIDLAPKCHQSTFWINHPLTDYYQRNKLQSYIFHYKFIFIEKNWKKCVISNPKGAAI